MCFADCNNRRHPERTLLYHTVAEHYETWPDLASAGQFDGQGDYRAPKPYVRKAFAKYLGCGIFAHGFARARCDDCDRHRYFGVLAPNSQLRAVVTAMAAAPAQVGTRVRGGPIYRESQLCMEMIADTGQLGSLDVVELNPALNTQNRTAEVAVDLIENLFGKSTLMRK